MVQFKGRVEPGRAPAGEGRKPVAGRVRRACDDAPLQRPRASLRRTLLAGARETWFAPNVPLVHVLAPPRPTPHALAVGRKLGLFFLLDSAFIRSKSQSAND